MTRFPQRCLVACLTALALCGALPAQAQTQEIVRLKTRGDVEQAYLLQHGPAPVKTVAVLFTGGFGLLKLRATEAGVAWEEKGNSFLMLNKDRFVDAETAIAAIDAPTDQWSVGYTPKFRKSEAHAADVHQVVQDLRARFPQAKVFLVGTSQGATSAAHAGMALGDAVDGVVLTASVFAWAPPAWRMLHDSNLSDFDFARIKAPLLIVHHIDDKCVATPYAAAVPLLGKHPFITVKGGEPVRDNGCGPLGPHGFLGQEAAVAAEILNWMHGRPYKAEIE